MLFSRSVLTNCARSGGGSIASQPPRLSRDLLVRAVAYRVQELRYGGLSKATSRKLAALVQARRSGGEIAPEGTQRIRTGRTVLREWNGRTHTITVEEEWLQLCRTNATAH